MLWCPDWPVIAAGITEGVRVHQPGGGPARQPGAGLLARPPGPRGSAGGCASGRPRGAARIWSWSSTTPGRDARAFEPVVAAVEELAPGVEVVRPGACAVAARGPASYYGGEAAAAERLVEHVALACGVEAQVGHRRRRLRRDAGGPGRADRAAGRRHPRSSPGWTSAPWTVPTSPTCCAGSGVRTLADFAALPGGRRAGPVRVRRRVRARPRRRAGRPPARGAPAAARRDGHRRVRPAAGAGRHGRLRRPGAGRAAARAAGRARAGRHPARHRGAHRRRRGAAPGVAPRRAARRRRDRRPGPLAARRLAHRHRQGERAARDPARPPHRRASTGCGSSPTAWSGTPACRRACGARSGWPTSGPTARWCGCRACSARTRSSPRCSAAGAGTPTAYGWCPGATNGARASPAATTEPGQRRSRRGRVGCPPRRRRPSWPSRPRSASPRPTARRCAVDARLAMSGAAGPASGSGGSRRSR